MNGTPDNPLLVDCVGGLENGPKAQQTISIGAESTLPVILTY